MFRAAATLLFAGLLLAVGPVRAEDELPADRQRLELPPSRDGNAEPGVELPPPPGEGGGEDAGGTGWAAPSGRELERARHMELTLAAFGAAGATAGLAVTFALASINQPTADLQRGWLVAAAVAGGVSAAFLVTGTVLWLTAPEAPQRVAIVPDGAGLRLVARF